MKEEIQELPLCLCGCGKPVTKPTNKYLKGHARVHRTGILNLI